MEPSQDSNPEAQVERNRIDLRWTAVRSYYLDHFCGAVFEESPHRILRPNTVWGQAKYRANHNKFQFFCLICIFLCL